MLIGFVVGVLSGILCWSYLTEVVIEFAGGKEARFRIAIGISEYKTTDGQTVILKQNAGKDVFIVNETDDVLALQRLHYGNSSNHDPLPIEIIHSHTTLLTKHIPDFYPWENPAEKILVDKSIEGDGEIRIWLRREAYGDSGN